MEEIEYSSGKQKNNLYKKFQFVTNLKSVIYARIAFVIGKIICKTAFSILLVYNQVDVMVQRVLNVLEGFAHRSLRRRRRRREWNMVFVYLNDTNTWKNIYIFVTPKHGVLEWDIDGLHFERSCFCKPKWAILNFSEVDIQRIWSWNMASRTMKNTFDSIFF